MSSQAQIDANDKPTMLAWNETTQSTETLYFDPVLNVLYIYAVPYDGVVATTLNTAKIDANENTTMLAYNETSGLPEAIRCGPNGEIIMTIVH